MRKKILLLVIVTLLSATFLLWSDRRNRDGTHSTRPSPVSGRGSVLTRASLGVLARAVDPASAGVRPLQGGWVLDAADAQAALAAAQEPQDLHVLSELDPKWIPTQTWQMSRGGRSEFAVAREGCAVEHLAVMDAPCVAQLSVVVDADQGKVVYARPLETDQSAACRAFSDCLAHAAWLGREAPMPAGSHGLHGFVAGEAREPESGSTEQWGISLAADMELAQKNLGVLGALMAQQPELAADPRMQQSVALERDLLDHSAWLHDQL